METLFQISLHVKTPSGFETYGMFDLGRDREKAMEIFSQLNGTDEVTTSSILYMDLSEIRNSIPYPVAIRHCTLEDIACNARVITRDVFKNLSL
jgi:flagellar motor switch protein FliM